MNPYITHPAIAAVEFIVLAAIIGGIFRYFGITEVPGWVFVAIVPGLIVSTFYFGREAGQREHDLKHTVPPHSEVKAFFMAEFALGWSKDNWAQWAVAMAACLTMTLLLLGLHLLGL